LIALDCVRYQDSVDDLGGFAISDHDDEVRPGPHPEEKFQVTLPGPALPLQPGKKLVFWATESDGTGGREHEDIMLRRVPAAVAHRFRGAAGARGFTHAQYLAALVALHQAMRERADGGDEGVAAVLRELGLGTIAI
jgi:hypothetical protein